MALRNIYVYSRRVELRNTNGRVSFAQPGILVLEVYIHSIDIDLCHLPSWGGGGVWSVSDIKCGTLCHVGNNCELSFAVSTIHHSRRFRLL